MYPSPQYAGIASLMSNPYGLPMTPMAPQQMAPQPMSNPYMAQQPASFVPQGMRQGFGAPIQSQSQPMPDQAYMQLPAMVPSPAVSGGNQNAPLGMYGGGMVRRMQDGGLAYIPLMYRGR